MHYVQLGNSGLSVSRFALGMMTYGTPQWRPWVLDEVASRPLVRAAIDAGINFLDTADMYSAGMSEELTDEVHGGLAGLREKLHAASDELLTDAIRTGDYIARIGRLLGM